MTEQLARSSESYVAAIAWLTPLCGISTEQAPYDTARASVAVTLLSVGNVWNVMLAVLLPRGPDG